MDTLVTKKQKKAVAIKLFRNAVDIDTPESNLCLAVIEQAVLDIDAVVRRKNLRTGKMETVKAEHRSNRDWHRASFKIWADLVGLDWDYMRQVLRRVGLFRAL